MTTENEPNPTVWIAPWGNDQNPGTKRLPLQTLDAAYEQLPPNGGTVRLHPGNYPPGSLTQPRT